MPSREKPDRQTQLEEFPPPPAEANAARDRETAALRALVKILAREAAREAFEGALARDDRDVSKGSER